MNTKRFLGAFLERRLICTIAGFGAALLFLYRDDALGLLLTPWAERTAQMTASILRWLGEEATRSGRIVSHPGGFAYEVHYHCVGFLPAAALVASVLASPGRAKHKVSFLVIGLCLLTGLNLGRLVHLFFVGVYRPDLFALAHSVVWHGIVVLSVAGLFFAWVGWVDGSSTRIPRRRLGLSFGRGQSGWNLDPLRPIGDSQPIGSTPSGCRVEHFRDA